MNRSHLVFAIAIAVAACSPQKAAAVPTAYYNSATGGFWFKNDTGGKLLAIVLTSETLPNVAKNDPSLYATIPGATFDPGDLPSAFVYLNFPYTGNSPLGIFIGNVIVPQTPTTALLGYGYISGSGTRFLYPIIEIPESSTLALAACGLAVFVRRRRR